MDLDSLYYFSELAKDLHITRTAARLHMSQQTLSNHIMRLEDYYGVKLLNRKPGLSLTTAGEYVLTFAAMVNAEQSNLKGVLFDVEKQERGQIRFGASALRFNACLPEVMPEFTARYPKVQLRLQSGISNELRPMVLEGELDMAIVLSGHDDPKLVSTPVMVDPIYICVKDELLRTYYGDESTEIKKRAIGGVTVSELCRLPVNMLVSGAGNTIAECYDDEAVRPNVYTTSSDTQIGLQLAANGLSACFVTHLRLISQKYLIPQDMNIFPLKTHTGKPVAQDFSMIYHRDRYISRYSRYFMELLTKYFENAGQTRMERIACR